LASFWGKGWSSSSQLTGRGKSEHPESNMNMVRGAALYMIGNKLGLRICSCPSGAEIDRSLLSFRWKGYAREKETI